MATICATTFSSRLVESAGACNNYRQHCSASSSGADLLPLGGLQKASGPLISGTVLLNRRKYHCHIQGSRRQVTERSRNGISLKSSKLPLSVGTSIHAQRFVRNEQTQVRNSSGTRTKPAATFSVLKGALKTSCLQPDGWEPGKDISWRKQFLSLLAGLLVLLGPFAEREAEAALVASSPVTLEVGQERVRLVFSELGIVAVPEAGSPDVGQTSLFSSENEELAADLFEKLSPSVVAIQNVKLAPPGRNSRGVQPELVIEGQGSGFVWDSYGHIVTNYHVVAKLATDPSGRQRTQVTIKGKGKESTIYDATLVGADSNRDIAVLKVDAPLDELQPITIGTSGDLQVGQSCFAIGNPFGFGQTLTTGVVSGLDRMIPSPSGKPIPGAIQTDAAINSGNSGGPLLDSFGRLIGVNTATFTRQGSGQSSGVNFAIPVDIVYRIVPRLIVYGSLNYENGLKP